MINFVKALFSEHARVSMMRVLCLLCVLFAGYIGIRGIEKGSELIGLTSLCGVFLTAAFTGKVMQKREEK